MIEDQSAVQNMVAKEAAGRPTSQVWVLGSGECDQLGKFTTRQILTRFSHYCY